MYMYKPHTFPFVCIEFSLCFASNLFLQMPIKPCTYTNARIITACTYKFVQNINYIYSMTPLYVQAKEC